MFCLKCGKNMKTNICEYCGTSDKVYHSNNYFKSLEMYELLSDDKDFNCIKEDEISEIQEKVEVFQVQNEKITEQIPDNTLKEITEDNIVSKDSSTQIKKRTHMTNKGKNVIIAVLCIIIVCISTAYVALLKRYNNITEINNSVSNNPENNNIEPNDNENSESSIAPVETEADKIAENTTITESTMNLSSKIQTTVTTKVIENIKDSIIQEQNKKAEYLFDYVKNQKYDDDIKIDKILSLYKNQKPIMNFSDDFHYEDEPNEYDINFAMECINGNNKWDSSVSCGELSDADMGNHKKLIYYFRNQNTVGKQYVLTDENDVPDIDDIIYIEPVNSSEEGYYYMARYCNNHSSMYIVINNNVYNFKFTAETTSISSETEQYKYSAE